MARNRALHRIALRGVSRINLSRRLICWMDDIRMPRTALSPAWQVAVPAISFEQKQWGGQRLQVPMPGK